MIQKIYQKSQHIGKVEMVEESDTLKIDSVRRIE